MRKKIIKEIETGDLYRLYSFSFNHAHCKKVKPHNLRAKMNEPTKLIHLDTFFDKEKYYPYL